MNPVNQGKFEILREEYPEFISLDQLHKVCRIAKRSAKYLLDHGIIPYQDMGGRTWKYKIALDDVITYLYRREEVGSMIPRGVATSRNKRTMSTRKCFAKMVTPGQETYIAEYFNFIFAEYDDILTALDLVEMTGLEKSTVLKLLKSGAIKSLMTYPKYLIPKQYLLEFVVTPRFIEYRTNSEHFVKILGGFEIWKNARISGVSEDVG